MLCLETKKTYPLLVTKHTMSLGIEAKRRIRLDLFFMVLDKIRYFSENTFGYNCIQEDIRT